MPKSSPQGHLLPFCLKRLGLLGISVSFALCGRVVAVELLEINVRQHYAALRKLTSRVLGLQDCEQCSDMEQWLETELQGTRKRADIASSMTFSQSR